MTPLGPPQYQVGDIGTVSIALLNINGLGGKLTRTVEMFDSCRLDLLAIVENLVVLSSQHTFSHLYNSQSTSFFWRWTIELLVPPATYCRVPACLRTALSTGRSQFF
jgi:hypothetical protein